MDRQGFLDGYFANSIGKTAADAQEAAGMMNGLKNMYGKVKGVVADGYGKAKDAMGSVGEKADSVIGSAHNLFDDGLVAAGRVGDKVADFTKNHKTGIGIGAAGVAGLGAAAYMRPDIAKKVFTMLKPQEQQQIVEALGHEPQSMVAFLVDLAKKNPKMAAAAGIAGVGAGAYGASKIMGDK
jgi:hypothetical protein